MDNLFKNRKFRILLQWLILVLLLGVLAYTLYQITTDVVVLKRRGIFSAAYRHHLFVISRIPSQAQPGEIQAWMSFRYVNLIFKLPPAYLKNELGISDTRYPNLSIATAAKAQGKTSAQELGLVQQKVESYISGQLPTTPKRMSHILPSLLSYVQVYKYLGIFIITFLGAFALPLPSGSIIVAAAAFAVQGYMNFWLVLVTGIAGNMAGDSSGYWVVRLYGVSVVRKIGLGRFFKQERVDYARELLNKHPILAIYFSRFFTAIAPAINIVAGYTQLPYKKFLLFEALGECTEVSFFALTGYILGDNWQYFSQLTGKLWIFTVVGAVLSVMLWRMVLKKKI